MGKEVLTSHSHRGFSPVMQTANRVEGTVSTVFLRALRGKSALMKFSVRGFSQGSAPTRSEANR